MSAESQKSIRELLGLTRGLIGGFSELELRKKSPMPQCEHHGGVWWAQPGSQWLPVAPSKAQAPAPSSPVTPRALLAVTAPQDRQGLQPRVGDRWHLQLPQKRGWHGTVTR